MADTTTTPVRIATVSGQPVIRLTLINSWGALTVPAYWCAVSFLTTNLARLPRQVRKGEEVDAKHPLNALLSRRPNRLQTAYKLFETLFFHLSHRRNGYLKIARNPITSVATSFHNVDPDDMVPFRALKPDADPKDDEAWYQFYHRRSTGEFLPAADVIHVSGLSYDGMAAMDPQALHESTLQRSATIDKYQTRFLVNGTVIRGVIEVEEHLTPEQADEYRAKVRQQFGVEGEDDILILWDKGKFKNATLTPEESQMDKLASYSIKDISRITGVPPEFLHDKTDAKYNDSAGQAGEYVAQFTLGPMLEMVGAELTMKLLTPAEQDAGYTIHLDPSELRRGSLKEQVDVAGSAVDRGLWSKNEGRQYLGNPKTSDPEDDKLTVRGGTGPQPAGPAKT